METPECDKLSAITERSQVIGEFLDWLQHERSVELCERDCLSDKLMMCSSSIEQLLAEYFEIDLEKVEQEKRAILDELRKQ